jgi:hypothetical protein
MFRGRHRPKGLEFPSCRECNARTSHSDLVASLIGRVFPDGDDRDQDDLGRILRGISNNLPGLLDEMHIGRAGQKLASRRLERLGVAPGASFLKANGPLLAHHMRVFGAKLGFALHFEHMGTPVPIAGGVQPMWFSNVQALSGEIPASLLEMLPSPTTLRAGRFEVSDQFRYSFVRTDEGAHSLVYAMFRQSFAVAAVSAVDRAAFLIQNADKYPIVVPGQLGRAA